MSTTRTAGGAAGLALQPAERSAIADLLFSIRCAEGLGLLSTDAASSLTARARGESEQMLAPTMTELVYELGRALAREVLAALEVDVQRWLEEDRQRQDARRAARATLGL